MRIRLKHSIILYSAAALTTQTKTASALTVDIESGRYRA
jgi:hypothetical protein